MEFSKVLVLSTAHLHPLEAEKIHEVSYISSATCFLVTTDSDLHEHFIKGVELPCLVDLLREVKQLYDDVDYVMFDCDANVEEQFRNYDWL